MKRITLGLALGPLAFLCGCVQAPQKDISTGPAIRLATWNLEHLAERDGTGCRPRTEADYAALRTHAERLDADVVAFQEVESAAAARRVFPAEQWTVVMSQRTGSDRSGACRQNPARRILKQDVGFAIRKSMRFTRNADLQALGLGDPHLRWGVDVTLDLPRPLRLLSIHLKSGCNAGQAPADPDCPTLFRQADVLEQWVDARARAGEDFALLGDWNRRTGLAGDAFLANLSDDDPPGGRLVLTGAGTSARCVARYRDFIDHIALGVRAATRLVPGSFAEYHYGGPEESHPSDHCPVSVAVRPR
jgi:endonuclease/exonuclease/phosphatase family metal-dependent hydrolase